ncbi:hypothetical protein D3C81_2202710 [compost metagenome]
MFSDDVFGGKTILLIRLGVTDCGVAVPGVPPLGTGPAVVIPLPVPAGWLGCSMEYVPGTRPLKE